MLINHYVCKKSLGELDPGNTSYYLDPTLESSRGKLKLYMSEDTEIETSGDSWFMSCVIGFYLILLITATIAICTTICILHEENIIKCWLAIAVTSLGIWLLNKRKLL